MALANASVAALKLDSRGHIVQILMRHYTTLYVHNWYDLDGNDLGAGDPGRTVDRAYRIDARGHIVAIMRVKAGEPGIFQWWNLAGSLVEEVAGPFAKSVKGLRVDARGHVREVQIWTSPLVNTAVWYDLNGDVAA